MKIDPSLIRRRQGQIGLRLVESLKLNERLQQPVGGVRASEASVDGPTCEVQTEHGEDARDRNSDWPDQDPKIDCRGSNYLGANIADSSFQPGALMSEAQPADGRKPGEANTGKDEVEEVTIQG